MFDMSTVMYSAFKSENKSSYAERLSFDGLSVRVGASDLACPRKTYYSKVDTEYMPTLSQMIRMRKGNASEKMMEDALTNQGVEFERQGSYVGSGIFDFIVIHPDIFIDVNKPGKPKGEAKKFIADAKKKGFKYILLELKTTNAIPSEPHDYWIGQTTLQAHIIAESLGIKPEEILISVFAIELNDGRHAQFPITYNAELALEIQEQALFLQGSLQDLLDFFNKLTDAPSFDAKDVPPKYGSLCSDCPWANDCIGTDKPIELPRDFALAAKTVKDYRDQKKNMDELASEVKEYILACKTSKATTHDLEISIRGGNIKKVLDTDEVTDEEMEELFKHDMRVFSIDTTKFEKLEPKRYAELVEKHPAEKKTAESLIIAHSKTHDSAHK